MNDLEHSGGEQGLKAERLFEVLSTCHWQINTDNANYFSFSPFCYPPPTPWSLYDSCIYGFKMLVCVCVCVRARVYVTVCKCVRALVITFYKKWSPPSWSW